MFKGTCGTHEEYNTVCFCVDQYVICKDDLAMSPTLVLKLLRGEGLEYYNNSEWFRRDFIAVDVSVDNQRRDEILADRRLHLICRLLDQIAIKMKVVKDWRLMGV